MAKQIQTILKVVKSIQQTPNQIKYKPSNQFNYRVLYLIVVVPRQETL
jgi:hypothetical protein